LITPANAYLGLVSLLISFSRGVNLRAIQQQGQNIPPWCM